MKSFKAICTGSIIDLYDMLDSGVKYFREDNPRFTGDKIWQEMFRESKGRHALDWIDSIRLGTAQK